MPLHWTIDHEKRLVVATAQGALRASDISVYLNRVVYAGAMPYAKLFDGSNATSFLRADDLEEFGQWLQDYMEAPTDRAGPLAIVASSPEQFVQAEFFSDAASGTRPVRVFRDMASAQVWLQDYAGQAEHQMKCS
jgi:hypothetical protein